MMADNRQDATTPTLTLSKTVDATFPLRTTYQPNIKVPEYPYAS
jgi:hypothetical protein